MVLSLIIGFVWVNSWNASHGGGSQQSTTIKQTPVDVAVDALTGLKEKTTSAWKSTLGQIQYEANTQASVAGVGASDASETSMGTVEKKDDIVYPEQVLDARSTPDNQIKSSTTATTTTNE